MNEIISKIMQTIVLIVQSQEDHAFFFDASKVLDDVDVAEMQKTLWTDFNIKSEKILDNVYLYYLGTLEEGVEKAFIMSAKIQYYIDYCKE